MLDSLTRNSYTWQEAKSPGPECRVRRRSGLRCARSRNLSGLAVHCQELGAGGEQSRHWPTLTRGEQRPPRSRQEPRGQPNVLLASHSHSLKHLKSEGSFPSSSREKPGQSPSFSGPEQELEHNHEQSSVWTVTTIFYQLRLPVDKFWSQ